MMREFARAIRQSFEAAVTARLRPAGRARRCGDRVKLALQGHIRVEVIGPDGVVKETREDHNLVVDAGLDWLAEYAFDSVTPTAKTRMSHIAIGTGTTAEVAGDTALQSEVERLAFDSWTAGGTGTCTVVATFPAAGGYEPAAVTEVGIFNDAAAGEMWNRATFAAVNKTSADTLKVTVTITFTAITA